MQPFRSKSPLILSIARGIICYIRILYHHSEYLIFKNPIMKLKVHIFAFAICLIILSNEVFSQPFHQWTKAMGGTGEDLGQSCVLDGSGNIYTTGRFSGTVDFDPGSGIFNLT